MAAFACILKFTDSFDLWTSFLPMITARGERAVDCEEFESLSKKWDQASQIRKWISTVKLQISEKIEKEEDTKYRDEYAEAHPSEDRLTGTLSDEHRDKVQERVDTRFEAETSKEFTQVKEKAKTLI